MKNLSATIPIFFIAISCFASTNAKQHVCENSQSSCDFKFVIAPSLRKSDFILTTGAESRFVYEANGSCVVLPGEPDSVSTQLFAKSIVSTKSEISDTNTLYSFLKDFVSVFYAITSCQIVEQHHNESIWQVRMVVQVSVPSNDYLPVFEQRYGVFNVNKAGNIDLKSWKPILKKELDGTIYFDSRKN